MTRWLRPDFHEVNDLRYGDVLAYRESAGGLLHTAVFLNEEWAWHKPG